MKWLYSHLPSENDMGWMCDGVVGVILRRQSLDDIQLWVEFVRKQIFSAEIHSGVEFAIFTYPPQSRASIDLLEATSDKVNSVAVNTVNAVKLIEAEQGAMKNDANLDQDVHPQREGFRSKDPESIEQYFFRATPWWKRTIDIMVSCLGLILLAPLFFAVAVLIKTVSRGPVFFRQERFGAIGRPFLIWKFRTMHESVNADTHQQYVLDLAQNNGRLNKLDKPKQIIPFGKLLRDLCIDELPQLINVLRGEMSLVGPRPDVIPMANYAPAQRRRFHVVPGITGLWQVSGKNETTFEEMIRLDLEYAQRRSFWLDVRILLMTIPVIIC